MFTAEIDALDAACAAVEALDLARGSDDDVLELIRRLEVVRNRLATTVDHQVVAEVDSRGVARERGCSSTGVLLTRLLRISAGEAAGRVRAAADLGPRRSLTGEPLAPIFAATAAACADGSLSSKHAALIGKTVTWVSQIKPGQDELSVEAFLVEQAKIFDPTSLGKIVVQLRDTIHQDGTAPTDEALQRRREVNVRQYPDGTVTGDFTLEPIAGEAFLTVLDALAAPQPAVDGAADVRTPGQRRHDALRDAMQMLLRTDMLPNAGGVSTTIVLTMTADQYENRCGLATTGHNALISVPLALTLVGDAQTITVLHAKNDELEAYSHTQRIFTGRQRLAMATRDKGCSFPGCTRPPPWCQAHHVTDYAKTRHTRVDDGTLLCGFHHREHQRLGWTCTMINGIPNWTPPAWIDPAQTPIRNTAHNPQDQLNPK